jgi:hypothetical protein
MHSRILAQRPAPVLLLDADTQTDLMVTSEKPQMSQDINSPDKISAEISNLHMSLVSRINELELQNAELQDSVDDIRSMLCEFKRMWESKAANEKQTDVLLRNIGVIS